MFFVTPALKLAFFCFEDVAKTRQRNLDRAITEFDVAWNCVATEKPLTITKRYFCVCRSVVHCFFYILRKCPFSTIRNNLNDMPTPYIAKLIVFRVDK